MGHVVGKDVYRRLGRKIDSLTFRAPWNETFHAILKEFYGQEEADLVLKMPATLTSFENLQTVTGYDEIRLRTLLESLCSKGLVMDLWLRGSYHYMPSPLIVGIFELTMMRTASGQDWKKISTLFHDYMLAQRDFLASNCAHGEKVSLLRTIPHEDVIDQKEYVEILDYERASAIIEEQDKFAIGTCSCRHVATHVGTKTCNIPLDTCSSFGIAAEFLARRGFARKVSRSEMKNNVDRSKELGLVLNIDNVQRNPTYLCQCCSDCCHLLLGMKTWGYTNVVITSSFLPETDLKHCIGCGLCARACPIDARSMVPDNAAGSRRKKKPVTESNICLGCGVCALKCKSKALTLIRKKKRVITPETTFERIILQCLERGTLQNQLFDNPRRITHKFMRGFLGGFLRLPPVKRALMGDALRSTFLLTVKKGAAAQGRGWITEL
ncbi:MAG TPA: 4Fe-4S binding protein [Thermodesulfovibrionales bacterium]|nr:4Fe-4S binding protein [Thermodesulfovibrionales bacterium]